MFCFVGFVACSWYVAEVQCSRYEPTLPRLPAMKCDSLSLLICSVYGLIRHKNEYAGCGGASKIGDWSRNMGTVGAKRIVILSNIAVVILHLIKR